MVETSSKSYKEGEEKKTDGSKVMMVVEVNTKNHLLLLVLHGQVHIMERSNIPLSSHDRWIFWK